MGESWRSNDLPGSISTPMTSKGISLPKALAGGQMWSVKTEEDARIWGLTELGWRDPLLGYLYLAMAKR